MGVRGYKPGELPIMAEAMAKDPQHAGQTPMAWVSDPLTENYVWDDAPGDNEDGKPIFFWRQSKVLRIDIQFVPELNGMATGKALVKGLIWLEERAKAAGFREIVFDSVYPSLIAFMGKLGFEPMGKDNFRKLL